MPTLTTRDIIQLAGPAITIIGILLSIYGTYSLTSWYHPLKLGGFLFAVFKGTGWVLIGEKAKALQVTKAAMRLGAKHERRARSLIGIYFIFVGFVLQAVGAFCWGADMLWGILKPGCAAG